MSSPSSGTRSFRDCEARTNHTLSRLLRNRWVPFGVLATVVIGMFHESVFLGRALFERDIYSFWHAQIETVVRTVASGALPLWDPNASFGEALFEYPPSALLYPLTWLNLVLRPWHYYTLATVVHLVFSGLGMYVLARQRAVSRGGALCAALLWILSGPALSVVNMMNLQAGVAWLPWAFTAADHALRTRRLRHATLWGATIAAPLLAGSETVLVAGLGTAAWAVLVLARHRGRHVTRRLAICGLAVLFALALAAAQWIPYLGLTMRTTRGSLSSWERTYWSVAPAAMLQSVLPVFPRDLPLRVAAEPGLAEYANPYVFSIYLGLPALALAAAAVGDRRRLPVSFFAALSLTGALFALGRHAIFYEAAYRLLPPVRIVRFPMKGMILTAFATSVLAGFGYDAWRRRRSAGLIASLAVALAGIAVALVAAQSAPDPEGPLSRLLSLPPDSPARSAVLAEVSRRLALVAALAALAFAMALAALRYRVGSMAAACLALLGSVDLALTHYTLNATAPRDLLRYRPPTLDVFRIDGGQRICFRELVRGSLAEPKVPKDLPRRVAVAVTMKQYLIPPTTRILDVASSYEEDAKRVHPHFLVDLYRHFRASQGTPGFLRMLQIGAVTHFIALDPSATESLVERAQIPSLFGHPIYVYRVPEPLPRAYAVAGVRIAGDGEAPDLLTDPSFAIREEIILPPGGGVAAPKAPAGRCRIVQLQGDRALIEADMDRAGYVVLVDTFDSGWKAYVDGRPVPVLRANLAFRAVAVPAGRHRVRLSYRPPGLALGAAATTAGLIAAAGLWLADKRAERRVASTSSTKHTVRR